MVSIEKEIERQTSKPAKPGTKCGSCRFFNLEKRFGFITDDESGVSIHVAASGIVLSEDMKKLREGTSVTYDVRNGSKGPTAVNVRIHTQSGDNQRWGQAEGAGGEVQIQNNDNSSNSTVVADSSQGADGEGGEWTTVCKRSKPNKRGKGKGKGGKGKGQGKRQ